MNSIGTLMDCIEFYNPCRIKSQSFKLEQWTCENWPIFPTYTLSQKKKFKSSNKLPHTMQVVSSRAMGCYGPHLYKEKGNLVIKEQLET